MTAQVSEKLIYKGESLSLCSNPLSPFLEQSNFQFRISSTACWRGYIGSWEIENGRLYLKSILGNLKNGQPINIETLFPGYSNGVFAHWYSGELRCPRGKLINYIHGGYASQYEEDMFILIERGCVISERVIKNGLSKKDISDGYSVLAQTYFSKREDK